ncbi:hypothetical protein HYV49_02175 [Candidatus Pacearchaeota archaeon]|nr:hypothetical protein [Candidatus Pacearchaeota archaeon]
MNLKRAIWVAVLTYAISFIIGLIVMMIMGVDPTNLTEIPNNVLYISIILTIIIAVFFTLLYFKGKRIKPNAKEGFYFGLILIIVGTILDIIIFSLSSLATGTQQSLIEYYSNPFFWIALILLLATTTIVGVLRGRKK